MTMTESFPTRAPSWRRWFHDARRWWPLARRAAMAAGSCLLVGACTTLLPSFRTEIVSDWSSYDDAVKSLATVAPYTSTRQTVHAQGLDPTRNPAITVLHFADVLQRFAAATLIKP